MARLSKTDAEQLSLKPEESVSRTTLAPAGIRVVTLHEIKQRLHRALVERLDMSKVEDMDNNQVAAEIRRGISILLAQDSFPLTSEERTRLAKELEFEILGLGPLEPLMQDNSISDILVNQSDEVYIERGGHLELTNVQFRDNAHLLKIINKIVSTVGRRIDESSPW
jgi:pilus assembly protein CpaF